MGSPRAAEDQTDTTVEDMPSGRDRVTWLWWFLVGAIPLVLCAAVYAIYPQAIAPSHLAACGGSYNGPGPTGELSRLDPIHGFQQVGTYRWAGVIAMPIWADSTCTDVYLQLNGHSTAIYFNDSQG